MPSLSSFLSNHKFFNSMNCTLVNSISILSKLWHFRLGHPSIKKSVVHFSSQTCNDICCNVCPLAKQKRLPFLFNNNVCSNAFDFIHFNIWGSYYISTHEGFKYFLSIVDDATRSTWVFFLMKSKSKTILFLISFFTIIHTQFGVKIKAIKSDNGLGFCMIDFYNTQNHTPKDLYLYSTTEFCSGKKTATYTFNY